MNSALEEKQEVIGTQAQIEESVVAGTLRIDEKQNVKKVFIHKGRH